MPRLVLRLCAAFLFGIALLDLSSGFDLLSQLGSVLLLALAVFCLLFTREWPAAALLLGATVAYGLRALGTDGVLHTRDPSTWRALQESETRRSADQARNRFRDLTEAARTTVAELGRDPVLQEALTSETSEHLSRAFLHLETRPLPRAHASGPPGATLFDGNLRPIAWSGVSGSLEGLLARWQGVPREEVAVLRRSAATSLVAVQPLSEGGGFVTVEVPLAADRRLENRYLQDYDALSAWAGRPVDVHFFASEEEQKTQGTVFETLGDPYWTGPEDGARLFFGLRDSAERLVGIASLASMAAEPAKVDRRRDLALAIAIVLVLAAGAAVLAFTVAGDRGALALAASFLLLRLVLRVSGLPLGFGLDLDDPAHYASSLLFGFARSPAEFLATTVFLLLACWFLARSRLRLPAFLGWLAPLAAFFLFLGVQTVVLDAWLNSSLALSEITFSSLDPPRLTVQLGLIALFFAAALAGHLLLAPRGGKPVAARGVVLRLLVDLTLIAIAYGLLSPFGWADRVLLASIPLVALHAFSMRHPVLAVRTPLALVLLSVAVFYPGIAWFERASIRNFIESTVTPVVLQHAGSRWSTLVEAARDIDRMYEKGEIADPGREDQAFATWVATDLSVSSLSSSVEFLDPRGRIASRFALNFPTIPPEGKMVPAPPEWVPEERRLAGNPDHPGFLIARRSFLGSDLDRWEVRIGVAADWRNLPFIRTSDPYLLLFRAAAAEPPLRYPHRELELFVLTRDGRAVFQSVGGSLDPGPALLAETARAPQWWDHDHEGQVHGTYLVADAEYIYAISYPKKLLRDYADELTRWLVFSGMVIVLGLPLAFLLSRLGAARIKPQEIFAGVGSSFSGKLYLAFVILALVSIVSLAFLIRGLVIRDLQRDLEREAVDRATVAVQVVRELHLSSPISPMGTAPLTDAFLERVSSLAGVDVDLYLGGELLATSKPELVASGLVESRASPAAQREIVLERRSHSWHRESVGAFPYLVVSVPIMLEPWTEPGILSIPLASRQFEIDRRTASLNQMLLLAAVAFSIAAAGLAYFLARSIAGPIRELTEATHAVAEGSLEVSLETSSRDEIGNLFASFNQMTEDLKRQRDDLEKSKKLEAWAEMARQVAHEVKNPLTPIQLSTEHLLRVYGDPQVDFQKVLKECAETILQQVKTLRQISMEFSSFASPGPLLLEKTDLPSLVKETVEPYRQSAPAGIEVRMDFEPALPEARVDRRLLKRTLVNLLENALHALNGKGVIEVALTRSGRSLQLSVRDNGVGIEPEVKNRVFEPYFSTRAAGTGLGLAIARKVIEDHGGTISLESSPGEGTKVTILLPVDH